MHGRTIFAATFVALAQFAVASPPGCLLGAVNEYSDPSDVKSVCKAKDLDSKVKEFCGDDTKAAMKALKEICGDSDDDDSDDVSSSGSASATGSASHSKGASATAASVVETISATSFVCSEATTITYGHSTYVVSSSTVLEIPEYTTKVANTEAPKATGTDSAGSAGSHGHAGASGSAGTLVSMYPTGSNGHGGNGTAPHATGGPKPGNGANGPNGANGYNPPKGPTSTADQPSAESTGAAGKLEFGMAAVVAGLMAAAL